MYGLKQDWETGSRPRVFSLEDYASREPRWCLGCGDHAILSAVLRLARDEQLVPEKTVFVSGIGCASRFPHYMSTYGFHSLHGRALPVACGIRSRRPDLNIFVATGDGDCCAIGTAHWIHCMRYNMNMTIMMFDNNIYGLTKAQTSPTTGQGERSNTHPRGSFLIPMNPLSVTLGIHNVSFVAQTVTWNPPHLYATLQRAHRHQGTSFVSILQRCPHFTDHIFEDLMQDNSRLLLLNHEDGINLDAEAARTFKAQTDHDQTSLLKALELVDHEELTPIGLIYHHDDIVRYDHFTAEGVGMSPEKKLQAIEKELDLFMV